MAIPLEKTNKLFGCSICVKHVFDPSNIGIVNKDALYLVHPSPDPTRTTKCRSQDTIDKQLPFVVPLQTPEWFFIHTCGRTWEKHMTTLKPSHAKKLRRYSRKPVKYGYRIKLQNPLTFGPEKLVRCHKLLCETMAYNGDHDFYTLESFVYFIRSLPNGVFVATHADGRVLGWYSGELIGHDHSAEFNSWGVYHNLFIAYVQREFANGAALVDLGNTNNEFKLELGGQPVTVSVELRSARSMRSAVFLCAWALCSMVPDMSPLCNTFRRNPVCATIVLGGLLLVLFYDRVCSTLYSFLPAQVCGMAIVPDVT